MDLLSRFRSQQIKRAQILCSEQLMVWFDHLEYSIHVQFDKNTKELYKYKKRKKEVNQFFRNAVQMMNRQQKVQLYLRSVNHLINLSKGVQKFPHDISKIQFLIVRGQCQTRSFNIKKWKVKKIKLDRKLHQIMVQKDSKIKSYDLRNYLLRKSKIQDMNVFVLEAINNKPHQKSRTVHLAFPDAKTFNKWLEIVKQQIYYCQWLNICEMFSNTQKFNNSIVTQYKINSSNQQNQKFYSSQFQINGNKNKDRSVAEIVQNLNNSLNRSFLNQSISTIQAKNQSMNSKSFLSQSMIKNQIKDQPNSPDLKKKTIQKSSLKSKQKPTQNQPENHSEKSSQIQQQKLFFAGQELDKQQQGLYGKRKTFIQHLVSDDGTNFQQLFDEMQNQTQNQIQYKKNLDFFHKLMPQYELSQLSEFAGYQTLVNEYNNNFQVFNQLDNPFRFKLIMSFNEDRFTQQQLFALISEPQKEKLINDNITDINIKTMVRSENSAIIYKVLKAQNKFYRQRDFIFIRHAFRHQNNVYFVDKSIDNMNFPPFLTLVRGQYTAIWGIFKDTKQKNIKIIADITIVNSGLLNNQQQINLSLKYLNAFKLIFNHYNHQKQISSLFDLDWNIDKLDTNKKIGDIRIKRKNLQIQKDKINNNKQNKGGIDTNTNKNIKFNKKPSAYIDGNTSPGREQKRNKQVQVQQPKINQQNKQQVIKSAQISPTKQTQNNQKKLIQQKQTKSNSKPDTKNAKPDTKNAKPQESHDKISSNNQIKPQNITFTQLQVKRNYNKDGYIITDNGYVKKKFQIKPLNKQAYKCWPKIKGHSIWKGDWINDNQKGGIIFINQKIIQDQKGVLKFILTKIGKNILSGKSVLNISLPVDIFAPESNLQRLLLCMAYGPKFLENLNGKSSLQKIINVIKFGVTNSVLYLNMEKPFNPILGETFQCWINGCPGYAEQISHHPPIAALMFYGRGYVITCQLQSKVELHMNSGCGTNEGIYKIRFDDGQQICFITPGGQVSGLTYGDRKFNLVGKSYYWIEKERMFMEIQFDAGKKGFFSKQEQPCDYFEGKLYEVTSQFFNTFPKNKKRDVTDKQKVKELGKFEGYWNKFIKFNDNIIFQLDREDPISIEYQKQPLGSDANWRQDIGYRRLNQTIRAQTEKQRLEVVQRTDRKHRTKYGPKQQKH